VNPESYLRFWLYSDVIGNGANDVVGPIANDYVELVGYPGGFVVPDVCEAWLDLHLPPDSSIDVLKKEMKRLLRATRSNMPDIMFKMSFEQTNPGYRISPEEEVVKRLQQLYHRMGLDWKPHDFRSHSDGNILHTAGVRPILLGPGRLEAAHTPEESVSFTEVVTATRIYLEFALSL